MTEAQLELTRAGLCAWVRSTEYMCVVLHMGCNDYLCMACWGLLDGDIGCVSSLGITVVACMGCLPKTLKSPAFSLAGIV